MLPNLNGCLALKATPYPPNYWRLGCDPTDTLRAGVKAKKVGGRGMGFKRVYCGISLVSLRCTSTELRYHGLVSACFRKKRQVRKKVCVFK